MSLGYAMFVLPQPSWVQERDLKLAVSSPVEDAVAEEAATAVLNMDK